MSEKIAAFMKILWIGGRITETELNLAVTKGRITSDEKADIMASGVIT